MSSEGIAAAVESEGTENEKPVSISVGEDRSSVAGNKRSKPSESSVEPIATKTTTTTSTITTSTENGKPMDGTSGNNNKRSKHSGKRKAAYSSSSSSQTSGDGTPTPLLSLEDILSHLSQLPKKVAPATIPQGNSEEESVELVKKWALEMQKVMEEMSFWLACLSTATYKWGSDRTGAAEQNVALLTSEVASSQEQLSNSLHQRLANVLAPVVDLVTTKTKVTTTTTTTKTDTPQTQTTTTTQEVRENEFAREIVDLNYFRISCDVLRRNSSHMRQVLLCHLQKVNTVLEDYQKALTQETDSRSQNNAFAY